MPRSRPHARLLAAVLSVLSAAGVVAVWALLVGTRTGQLLDSMALDGSLIGAWRLDDHARALLHVVSMPAVVALVLAVLALGLVRGVRRQALWACVTVVGTNLSTQVLKHSVLARPDWGYSERWDAANTLPSGHTAVAASAAVALVLVVPARWRPTAAWAGAALTFLMGFSTLVCQWHRPSDVVAAVLLALAWGWAAVAGGALGDDAPGEPDREPGEGTTGRAGSWVGLRLLAALGLLAAVGTVLTGTGALAGITSAGRTELLACYATGAGATLAVSTLGTAVLAACATASSGAGRVRSA